MARRFVYGSYLTFDEADIVVDELLQQGIREDSVAIVANDTSNVPDMYTKQVLTLNRTDETSPEEENSWWENLFGFLRSDEYDATTDQQATDFGIDYSNYQTSLNNGEFLVVVDSSYESLLESNRFEADSADHLKVASMDRVEPPHDDLTTPSTEDTVITNVPYSEGVVNPSMENELRQEPPLNDIDGLSERNDRDLDVDVPEDTHLGTDSESIKLHEEQVNVETHREQVGEVRVTKEVVEDTKVVEVPVQREEVHITHVHPTDSTTDDPNAFVEETIEIPVSEDRIDVSKDTVVTDEVRIDRDVEETVEEVTETTRREVIDVDGSQHLTNDLNDGTPPLTDESSSILIDDDDLQKDQTN